MGRCSCRRIREGVNLNGDGDMWDDVVHVRDLESGSPADSIIRIGGFPPPLPPPAAEPRFRRGDCNGDGEVNLSDAACAVNWLFAGAPTPGCPAAVNTNGDDDVNITDPVSLLNFLFAGGSAPAAPFPDCGPGMLPADAALGCANPPNC